jgi:hypothetical protein
MAGAYANEAFLKLFGVRAENIIGQVFRPENHPDSPPVTFGASPAARPGPSVFPTISKSRP